MKTSSRTTTLLAVLLASTGAGAQTTLSANITNLHYTLQDLTPDDGATSSLTWLTPKASSSANAYTLDLQNNSTSLGSPSQTISGAFDASTVAETSLGRASTSKGSVSVSASFPAGSSVSADGMQGGQFSLAAFTSVTFDLDYALAGTAKLPDNAVPSQWGWAWFDYRYYQGGAFVRLAQTAADGSWLYDGNQTRSINFWSGTWDMSQTPPVYSQPIFETHADQNHLSLTITNNSAMALTTGVLVEAKLSMYAYPGASVPELATWGQMGLGLACLGMIGRGRLQQGQRKLRAM